MLKMTAAGLKTVMSLYPEACVKLYYGRKIKNSKQADKYKSTGNIVKMNAVSTTVN